MAPAAPGFGFGFGFERSTGTMSGTVRITAKIDVAILHATANRGAGN
jgi:hypothetical protein